jgi:hypothetical protein
MTALRMRSTPPWRRSRDPSTLPAKVLPHSTAKIIGIARRNVNSSFDLATSLAGAKNLADMVELQAAHWRKQFDTLTAQAEEIRALSTKVITDATEAIKTHVARGGDGLARPH